MEQDQELDLKQLWQILANRWKLLLFLPLSAVLFSALFSMYTITPQYNASATILIRGLEESYPIKTLDIMVSRLQVGTYLEIARSRQVLLLAIANSDLPFEVGELRNKIDVVNLRDTEIIAITATNADPEMAARIANGVATAFEEVVKTMQVHEKVSLLNPAEMSLGPVNSRLPLNVALALIVGMMAAVGLAFFLAYIDRTIKEPGEISRLLDLPVLSVIPQMGKNKASKIDSGKLLGPAIEDHQSPVTEAFRTLKTAIYFAGANKPIRKVLITGANPGCGKSTTAAELGVTIAQTGARVLLLDTNMSKPVLHRFFEQAREPGLSDILGGGEIKPEEVIRKTAIENLFLLPSGPLPPYPAEMLGSERMKQLVELLSGQYEYLIFDSPPVIDFIDTLVLDRLADGTVLVLDYGRVTRDEAVLAAEQLRQVNSHLIGAVLNATPDGNKRSKY